MNHPHNPWNIAAVQTLVKQRCGLQFEGADQSKLEQALAQRCQALGLPAQDYYPHLVGSGAEFQALVNLLTINETYFFREPEQIDLLVQRLLPRLLQRVQGQRRIRILSAGCSTGEEPYSLAMALLEKYGDNMRQWFTLLGADIDSQALAKARAARYSDFSFRGLSPALRERYFFPSGKAWQLQPVVQELVQFHELNLLSQYPPTALMQCDVIFFRNVSIYFDTPTRRQIQHNLARLLQQDGVLMIGTAETLANDLGVLPLVEEAGLFYFSSGAAPVPPRTPPVALATCSVAPPLPAPLVVPAEWKTLAASAQAAPAAPAASDVSDTSDAPEHPLARARQAMLAKDYAQALPLLEAIVAQHPGQIEARLLLAYALLERQDFARAQAVGEQVLQSDPWSVDACVLLGLAAKWQDDLPSAARWLRQAIYVRHDCWPAHYFLADVLRASGTLDAAQRAWRVVVQCLERPANAGEAPLPTGLRYLPLHLPVADIRFLCQRHLAHSATGAEQR